MFKRKVLTQPFISLGIVTLLYGSFSNQALSADVEIIKPEKQVEEVPFAALDTEKFEIGFNIGTLAVEDFGNSLLTTVNLSYHISPSLFVQFSHGQTEVEKAAFEDATNRSFLSDDDREFTFNQLGIGYRLFNGKSFLSRKYKFSSNIYITSGLESIDFAGDTNLGLALGTKYKVVATDWLTFDTNLVGHAFNRDFLSDSKLTYNVEFSVGLNAMF